MKLIRAGRTLRGRLFGCRRPEGHGRRSVRIIYFLVDHSHFPKDLTDRFDYSFLCGDLNFRLDISRLHADWLISRQGIAVVHYDTFSRT